MTDLVNLAGCMPHRQTRPPRPAIGTRNLPGLPRVVRTYTQLTTGARVFAGVGAGARSGKGAPPRCLAALTAVVALAALVLAGPAAPRAEALSVCSGQPRKTVSFATGELRVYKARGYACALTVAKDPGARRAMRVSLQARGGSPLVDSGDFTRHAGPVTVHALNRCVRVSGAVSGTSGSTGWILC
jgi:hypothetical protein